MTHKQHTQKKPHTMGSAKWILIFHVKAEKNVSCSIFGSDTVKLVT